MRHEAKCFVLAVGVMLMVASAAGQQFQLMEASINEIHRVYHRLCSGQGRVRRHAYQRSSAKPSWYMIATDDEPLASQKEMEGIAPSTYY